MLNHSKGGEPQNRINPHSDIEQQSKNTQPSTVIHIQQIKTHSDTYFAALALSDV